MPADLTHMLLRACRRITYLFNDLTPFRRLLSDVRFLALLLRRVFDRRLWPQNVWVIGEARGATTLDNGYYFFEYCCATHPTQEVFFVVSKCSAYFPKLVESRRNVVAYGSVRHLKAYLRATVCLYTHTYSDFILREQYWLLHKRKRLVFLHHGVLGFKRFDHRYMAEKGLIDIVTVGTEYERQLFIHEIGVPAAKVRVTGYARFDALEDHRSTSTLRIAYVPTHRDWLREMHGEFARTEFFRAVEALLYSKSWQQYLESTSLTLMVRLHPVMQRFAGYLGVPCNRMELVTANGPTLHELICTSQLLITDYSSVAWDFLYLRKPVIFYRFDISRYLRARGSYIPLTSETFGPVCTDASTLLRALKASADRGFTLPAELNNTLDAVMIQNDHKNAERIYDVTSELARSQQSNDQSGIADA